MSNSLEANCEIVIATSIGGAWSEWFDAFEVITEGTTSRLVGTVADQAALHGVLGWLRDLGIPILDVHVSPGPGAGTPIDRNTPAGTRHSPSRSIRSNYSTEGGGGQ